MRYGTALTQCLLDSISVLLCVYTIFLGAPRIFFIYFTDSICKAGLCHFWVASLPLAGINMPRPEANFRLPAFAYACHVCCGVRLLPHQC